MNTNWQNYVKWYPLITLSASYCSLCVINVSSTGIICCMNGELGVEMSAVETLVGHDNIYLWFDNILWCKYAYIFFVFVFLMRRQATSLINDSII